MGITTFRIMLTYHVVQIINYCLAFPFVFPAPYKGSTCDCRKMNRDMGNNPTRQLVNLNLSTSMDIRLDLGVKINKISGSRAEYIPFPLQYMLRKKQSFSFQFKTQSSYGLIFLAGNFDGADLVSAYLIEGYVVFARRCVYGLAFEVHSNRTWNDGLWHDMKFTLDEHGGRLEIDSILDQEKLGATGREYHMGPCNSFNSLVFGGLSHKIYDNHKETLQNLPKNYSFYEDNEPNEIVKHRFSGCIRKLTFEGKHPTVPPKYFAVSTCED